MLQPNQEQHFRRLYEDHVGAVARYIARRAKPDDVQDVVAETFLVAWRRLDAVPQDALPWFLSTARNVLANKHRTRRRTELLQNRLAQLPRWDTTTVADSPELDATLIDAINALPPREREAFMLVAWDALDQDQAARAADCGRATFRMRLHRARRRLRSQLEDRPFVQPDPVPTLEEL